MHDGLKRMTMKIFFGFLKKERDMLENEEMQGDNNDGNARDRTKKGVCEDVQGVRIQGMERKLCANVQK